MKSLKRVITKELLIYLHQLSVSFHIYNNLFFRYFLKRTILLYEQSYGSFETE